MLKELIPYVFETGSPESTGVRSESIIEFIKRETEQKLNVQGFMLYRHGKVIARAVAEPYKVTDKRHVYSISKSYTGTAIGIARDEGLLDLDDKICDIFPEYVPENPSENLKKMTIHHLLCMNTGHGTDTTNMICDTEHNGENLVKTFMSLPVEHEPGTKFIYNSGASYMLSAIITKKTGMSLHEYITPRLLNPLGIRNTYWDACPMGINYGGWGLHVSVRDMLKLGVLYLHGGMWDGMRIVSQDWVDRASSFQSDNSKFGGSPDWQAGYGYQMWRCQHNSFRGDGAYVQLIIISPDKDMVMSLISEGADFQRLCNDYWDTIYAGAGDAPLEENPVILAELGKACETVSTTPRLSAEFIKDYTGRFSVDSNPYGIKGLNIKTDSTCAQIEMVCDADGKEESFFVEAGNGEWYYNKYDRFVSQTEEMQCPPKNLIRDAVIAASFAWKDSENLCINVQHTDSPHGFKFVINTGKNPCVTRRSSMNVPGETVFRLSAL